MGLLGHAQAIDVAEVAAGDRKTARTAVDSPRANGIVSEDVSRHGVCHLRWRRRWPVHAARGDQAAVILEGLAAGKRDGLLLHVQLGDLGILCVSRHMSDRQTCYVVRARARACAVVRVRWCVRVVRVVRVVCRYLLAEQEFDVALLVEGLGAQEDALDAGGHRLAELDPVVRQVGLLADQHDAAGEALAPQRLSRGLAGSTCTPANQRSAQIVCARARAVVRWCVCAILFGRAVG